MPVKKNRPTPKRTIIAFVTAGIVILALILFLGIIFLKKTIPEDSARIDHQTADIVNGTAAQQSSADGIVRKEITVLPEINYQNLEQEGALKSLMDERKQKMGMGSSLDMIVNSDEQFTVGDTKISMGEILKQAFVEKGQVYEESITASGEVVPHSVKSYGIYVVQPGDNIWNIHFDMIKDFYAQKGIRLSSEADEPDDKGLSSGIGKILKFSETMVVIYNLKENKVDSNIDLIEPLSKIVVYNMDEVFSFLNEVNPDNIDRIQFDGKTIWIPTRK